MPVSALFVRKDSIYKSLLDDCYDIERDALTFSGNNAIVAHPPCRSWSRLRHFSKHKPGEELLALFAIDVIRRNGGVLEHPAGSALFNGYLHKNSYIDSYGGYVISVNQHWFGHRAAKKTYLYIVGCPLSVLPALPLNFNAIECTVSSSVNIKSRSKKEITKKEREQTPPAFAEWLINVASLCYKYKNNLIS